MRAKRRDANEGPIIDALERAGAEVWITDRPADLLVWHRSRWYVLETKAAKGRFSPKQLEERAQGLCRGIITVRTPLQALAAIGALRP